jgi:hypothetical protein
MLRKLSKNSMADSFMGKSSASMKLGPRENRADPGRAAAGREAEAGDIKAGMKRFVDEASGTSFQ